MTKAKRSGNFAVATRKDLAARTGLSYEAVSVAIVDLTALRYVRLLVDDVWWIDVEEFSRWQLQHTTRKTA